MAAEMINAVLKAEAVAKKEETKATKIAEEIRLQAKLEAEVIYEKKINQANIKAEEIIRKAIDDADGYVKQANTLADLRERKMISDSEKNYRELIEMVKTCILK